MTRTRLAKFRTPLLLLVAAGVPLAVLTVKYDVVARVQAVGLGNAVEKTYHRLRRYGIVATWKSLLDRQSDDSSSPASSLTYSLYDTNAYPALEDPVVRNAMPEYKNIPGVDIAHLSPSRDSGRRYDTWYRSGGDEFSSKYSSLSQIHVRNVRYLEPAWTFRSGADLGDSTKTGGVTVETNPVIAGNRLFVTSAEGLLVSLDAETGREVWRLALPAPVAKRGMVWEAHSDFAKSRLFVPTGHGVFAVNAASGEVLRGFGKDGQVGNKVSLIAPLIVGNRLIIATLEPSVEAYDLVTGRPMWARSLLEKLDASAGHLAGGAPWGGMSADLTRSSVFVTTGNPRPALLGTARPGDNRYSCSIVSINAETGEVAWSFQEVSHDLWDLDIPAAPVLTTISKGGKRIDVVAVLTKAGNTLLLDRDFGKPIFGYQLRRAPVSTVPGEHTAPYQPVFALPEPFSKQNFEPGDLTDLSDSALRTVARKIRGARSGFFVPPSIGGKIALYGLHGGAEWPGGAVDPTTAVLYVPSNRIPWLIRMAYADTRATAESGSGLDGDRVYKAKCARCHGSARGGSFEWEGSGDAYFPSLTGITVLREKQALVSTATFKLQHEGLTLDAAVTPDDLQVLYAYFSTLDKRSDAQRSFTIQAFWQLLLDERGNPGTKPPWGMLTALDLNSGKKRWQVPLGQRDDLGENGIPVRGLQNIGGVTATAGGLLFVTGTTDNKIRALDSSNGSELWSYALPAAGSTIPSTYSVNGVQYVVVVATGGVFRGFSGRSDRVIAFRLPPARR